MLVKKNMNVREITGFTWFHMIWLPLWATAMAIVYEYLDADWLKIPWLPLSIVGTAVAFYIGFKNNSAYDRLWEARKIWGAIVNSSRMWGSSVQGFVSNQFKESTLNDDDLKRIHQKLMYRHIAWLYVLRDQLLIPTQWEHLRDSHTGWVARFFEKRKNKFGVGLFGDHETKKHLDELLDPDEKEKMINHQNTATQLINKQAEELKTLRAENLIDDFRHMELQQILNDFYAHQGKCERIKKFPLPRQYGSMSFTFVAIFIVLLPFGMIPAFLDMSPVYGNWIAIPFIALVGWVYITMELIGDYSENPFEGLGNDIPMLSLCRVIEIDLREMMSETDLPPAIQPVNNVLL
jgi:putative membrane protein